jgi:hypothetical protein
MSTVHIIVLHQLLILKLLSLAGWLVNNHLVTLVHSSPCLLIIMSYSWSWLVQKLQKLKEPNKNENTSTWIANHTGTRRKVQEPMLLQIMIPPCGASLKDSPHHVRARRTFEKSGGVLMGNSPGSPMTVESYVIVPAGAESLALGLTWS